MLFSAVTPLILGASLVSASCNAHATWSRHHSKKVSSTASSAQEASTQAVIAQAAARQSSSAAKSGASGSKTASSTASASTSTSTTGWGLQGLQKNGIYWGFLPDDGSGGGTAQTLQQINSAVGKTAAAQGWYAQAQSGTTFTGSQFTSRMDEIVENGVVFQATVMPTGGWQGLTSSDGSQAEAICTVMQKFVDKGLEVWLRFGHEVNWYQTDGTYTGDANDFKEGWAAVAKACRSIAPEVKLWYTPNVANLAQYEEYFPDDISTVDLIGVDWYPSDPSTDFVAGVQAFHDKYTSSTTKFAQGETGLAQEGTLAQRLQWAATLTSDATIKALPNYIACSWFNYWKGYEFRIAAMGSDSATVAFFA